MNLSISDELELVSKELQRYMSPNTLEQLARKIGFVQRRSNLGDFSHKKSQFPVR